MSKPTAEQVLERIRDILFPPGREDEQWDSNTLEFVSREVNRHFAANFDANEDAAADALEERIMALSARWPDSSSDLDEIVSDAFSGMASSINNEGTTEQIRWLLANGWTIDGLEAIPDE